MRKMTFVWLALLALAAGAGAAEKFKFWNLTAATITDLRMAPAGTDKWGANQCLNDSDKSVDHDERLTLTDVTPGRYDVKFTDKTGRSCLVKNVEVKSGRPYAFSISEKELKDCKK
jgi:hypothetical protein